MFGLAVLALMITQLDFAQVWSGLSRAGYWFVAVIALWFFLYMFNTASWYVIINNAGDADDKNVKKVGFWWLYKITVSWFLSVLLYVVVHPLNIAMGVMLLVISLFSLVAIWFFVKGYKKGIAVSCLGLLSRFPLVKRWAQGFFERHREQLANIDSQIASLHNQNPKAFVSAVLLELSCRIVSALEIYFILLVIQPSANYLDSILILAFTSLFANMLFFMPLQLGGREGGFLMSAKGLSLTTSAGIFVALIVRVR